ncbi:MAG: excinuclease ABC subunit C, partial [bacterium]
FDTSSLFGRHPVGSMVCFVSGGRNTRHYRKFRIQAAPPARGGDDFAMIREIVGRRLSALKKSGEPLPDLLLIDGGKGQLSAALAAAGDAGVRIPTVSIAKKNEEIYIPGRTGAICLKRSSQALQLLQRLRDEAHRFGISYHRKLRNKKLLTSG